MADRRQNQPIWAAVRIIHAKYVIGSASIPEALIYCTMVIMWAFGLIKSFPDRVVDYGFIYHIPHATSWIISLGVATSNSIELFNFAFLVRLCVLVTDGIAFSFGLANIINCYIGALPEECRETQFADWVIMFMSFSLFLISLVIFWNVGIVVKYVRNAQRIRIIREHANNLAYTAGDNNNNNNNNTYNNNNNNNNNKKPEMTV